MFLQNPKTVYAASERQYSVTGGGVCVPWGGRRKKQINTGIGKVNVVLSEILSPCGDKTRDFKHR